MRSTPTPRHTLRRKAYARMAGAAAGALGAGAIARAAALQPPILYLVLGITCGSALGGWIARRR